MNGKELYLYKYDIGTKLILSFEIKDKTFEFPTKIEQISGSKILLSPIKLQGKILNLENATNKMLILIPKDKKPIAWSDLSITILKVNDDKSFYLTDVKTKGEHINRRGAFRVPLNISCNAQVNDYNLNNNIEIKDISATGFSIVENGAIIENNIKDLIGKPTLIKFIDQKFNYEINLHGIIKRVIKDEDGKYIYGCELSKEDEELNSYIVLKQREILTKKSGIKNKINYSEYQKNKKVIKL